MIQANALSSAVALQHAADLHRAAVPRELPSGRRRRNPLGVVAGAARQSALRAFQMCSSGQRRAHAR
jgi:hypothetical protein